MTAHLRCSRCGRSPYLELNVRLTDDGAPLCDGTDCEDVAASLHAMRRTGYKGLFAAAVLASMGAPASAQRHIARQGSSVPDEPRQAEPSDTLPAHIIPERIRRAEEKRARRAEKRRRSA